MGGLVVIGLMMFVFGAILALTNVKNVSRRKRILATPTASIAQAPGNAVVEIKGRIYLSEQGYVQAPFSGRSAVWFRVTIQERRSSGRNSYWRTILSEIEARPFLVEDGSGQLARVMPHGANVVLDKDRVASSGTFNDAAPHLEAFLISRGIKSTSWLGFNKAMRYEEEVLSPGDFLYALGPSRRDPGPPVHDGYRMVPGTQLVMFPATGALGELILTNKTEDQLTRRLLHGFTAGLVIGGIGLIGCLYGVLLTR